MCCYETDELVGADQSRGKLLAESREEKEEQASLCLHTLLQPTEKHVVTVILHQHHSDAVLRQVDLVTITGSLHMSQMSG